MNQVQFFQFLPDLQEFIFIFLPTVIVEIGQSGVSVLKGVKLTVEKGEVHALLGENGAGKSTLMNILTGVLPKDGGTIEFDGQKLEHITITQSEKMGIAFVHQELNLFNDLKVFENMFLNREYTN